MLQPQELNPSPVKHTHGIFGVRANSIGYSASSFGAKRGDALEWKGQRGYPPKRNTNFLALHKGYRMGKRFRSLMPQQDFDGSNRIPTRKGPRRATHPTEPSSYGEPVTPGSGDKPRSTPLFRETKATATPPFRAYLSMERE